MNEEIFNKLLKLRNLINIPEIERIIGIYPQTITKALDGKRPIPKKYYPLIEKILKYIEKHLKGLK